MPQSTPDNVQKNMVNVINKFNNSNHHIIKKTAFLAYQIYINQPFIDGNKRTARLLTTLVTLREGLPFSSFNKLSKKTNFNHSLITTFLKKDNTIFESFLAKVFTTEMAQKIEKEKKLSKKNYGTINFL